MSSYSSINVMFVFGVKYRLGLIDSRWEKELYSVLGRLAVNSNCKPLAINGMKDHVHILLEIGKDAPAIKEIVKSLKSGSSKWVNDNRLTLGRFAWQAGGSRFSYSYRELDMIIKYVQNQKKHHSQISYLEETKRFLKAAKIEYDAAYLPGDPE